MYELKSLNLSSDQGALENGEVVSTLMNLKKLYKIADESLSAIASSYLSSEGAPNLQNELLEQKEALVALAIKIKCRDIYEISHKIDFLNLVHLQEISADDFSETDSLTKSIWKDCRSFL